MAWYAKQSDTWAEVISPYVKSNNSWVSVTEGWVKNAGVWQRFYNRDLSPPGSPSITVTEQVDTIRVVATVSVGSNAAQLDLRGLVTKGPQLGQSFSHVQDVSAGDMVAYYWQITPKPDSTYRVEGRLISGSGVSSTVTVEILDIPPETQYYQAYIEPTNSDSWVGGANGEWKTDTNQVIQGGVNNLHRGCWFYGDRLDRLFGNVVTKMEIQITRLDTTHGVAGPANVRLGHHDNKTKPSGPPIILDEQKVGELRRGERAWFTVPNDWYSGYRNNNANFRGFGLQTSDLGENSPNYIRTPEDNTGTFNGRLYVEWHD